MLKKTIALTWGSTWGHIFPLISLYNYLNDSDHYDFLWFWEKWNLEEEIASNSNINFYDISSWKIRRYFDIRNFFEPLKNLTWIIESLFYINKYNIDIVFSKGWYVSLPMAIWAKIMRKKLFIHESDTVSWISNKLVSKMADKVFYSFDNDKVNNSKHIYSGQILNPELLDSITDLNFVENKRQKVLVMWWSQGSKSIFENLLWVLWNLDFLDFEIVLWDKNLWFKEEFSKFPNVTTHDFVSQSELWNIYINTDIALTRAWATSLFEQNVFWIHSIIIPLSSSAWNHQEENAIYFKEKFESDILKEDDHLASNIQNKLTKYRNLRKAWLNLDKFYNPLKIIEANIKKNIYKK